MGINSLYTAAAGSDFAYFAVKSASTYPLVLTAGFYVFSTDTTQSFTAYLTHTNGYKTPVIFRGGNAYVQLPLDSINIELSSLTNAPALIGYKSSSRTPIAAPTSVSTAFGTAGSAASTTNNITFTAASGTTDMILYFRDGTNQLLSSTTSVTAFTINSSALPAYGSTVTYRIASLDAFGISGLTTEVTTSNIRPTFTSTAITSTGSWTAPNTTNQIEITVVAGGGAGARYNNAGGGGGAGGVIYNSAQNITPGANYPITIGTGGNRVSFNASLNVPNGGGATNFGNLFSAVGGGRGGNPDYANATSGGSGGGAASLSNAFGNGTAGQGNPGAAGGGGGTNAGGGGGGYTNAGSVGTTGVGGSGGLGFAIPGFNTVAAGGSGSFYGVVRAGSGTGSYGGGSPGMGDNGEGTAGGPGLVYLRYNS
jgi:hypothetical protein